MKAKSILVTGASGFLGRSIAAALLDRAYHVILVGRRRVEIGQAVSVEADLREPKSLWQACAGLEINAVIHAAAGIPGKGDNGQHNVEMTCHVLAMARELSVQRFVFASSCAVYGDQLGLPCIESTPPCPASPYAQGKLENENHVQAAASEFYRGGCSLRLSAPFGANSTMETVIHRFLRQAAKGGPVTVFGNGTRRQHFVYVDDVTTAFCLAVEASASGVFNIAGPAPVSMLELAARCAAIFGHTNIVCGGHDPQENFQGDFPWTKAFQAFGYSPASDLGDGLRRTAVAMGLA